MIRQFLQRLIWWLDDLDDWWNPPSGLDLGDVITKLDPVETPFMKLGEARD